MNFITVAREGDFEFTARVCGLGVISDSSNDGRTAPDSGYFQEPADRKC